MATPDQENMLRVIADVITEVIDEGYGGKAGFFLCCGPFESVGVADYISNVERDNAILWLRETADRLEKNQGISAGGGNA